MLPYKPLGFWAVGRGLGSPWGTFSLLRFGGPFFKGRRRNEWEHKKPNSRRGFSLDLGGAVESRRPCPRGLGAMKTGDART